MLYENQAVICSDKAYSIDSSSDEVYPPSAHWSSADMAVPPREEIVVKGHLAWLSRSLGIPPWGQVLIALLFVGAWWLHSSFGTIEKQIADHDTKLQLLPLEISKDLLSQALTDTKLGRLDRAERITETATAIIAKASTEKIQAPPDYFKGSIEALNSISYGTSSPSLLGTVQGARLMLANYRSALEPLPAVTKEKKEFEGSYHAGVGEQFNFSERSTLVFIGPSEMIVPPLVRKFSINDVRIRNLVIATPTGASQTLDGIHWKDVIFVGAHIKYEGGDLDLQNVRFVNCTFDVIPSPKAQQFIDYAALAMDKLEIG